MASTSKSSLQSRIQGVTIPDLPPFNPTWTLKEYNDQMVIWQRKLHEWMRRQFQQLTGPNIYNELVEQVTDFITIINASHTQGLGPLLIEFYADATWVNAASVFNGTKYGEFKISTLNMRHLEYSLSLGDNNSTTGVLRAIRVTGKFVPGFTEDYDLELLHDDGARLYIDNVLKIDQWGGSGTHQYSTEVGSNLACTAGVAKSFKIETINQGGSDLSLRLFWTSTSQTGGMAAFEDIPYSALLAP